MPYFPFPCGYWCEVIQHLQTRLQQGSISCVITPCIWGWRQTSSMEKASPCCLQPHNTQCQFMLLGDASFPSRGPLTLSFHKGSTSRPHGAVTNMAFIFLCCFGQMGAFPRLTSYKSFRKSPKLLSVSKSVAGKRSLRSNQLSHQRSWCSSDSLQLFLTHPHW